MAIEYKKVLKLQEAWGIRYVTTLDLKKKFMEW